MQTLGRTPGAWSLTHFSQTPCQRLSSNCTILRVAILPLILVLVIYGHDNAAWKSTIKTPMAYSSKYLSLLTNLRVSQILLLIQTGLSDLGWVRSECSHLAGQLGAGSSRPASAALGLANSSSLALVACLSKRDSRRCKASLRRRFSSGMISLLLPLSQNKSGGQSRFKRWRDRPHLLI